MAAAEGRGIRSRNLLGAGLALAILAGPAQGQPAPSPKEFCVAAESTARARRICEADYERSLDLFLQYGRAEGYIDADGAFAISRVFRDVWSWRTFVGLPPDSPFLMCSDQADRAGGAYDFRAIWDCITANDPKAARMDAI